MDSTQPLVKPFSRLSAFNLFKSMANQWFKFYGAEYLSDPKMDRLTVQERSCWLTLLCMASQSNGVIKYLSTEGLLLKSGITFDPYDTTEWDNALDVLRTFEKYEMIKIHQDGTVEITNWGKRQEHNLSVNERVAKHRENKKKEQDVTINVTNVTSEENRIEENRIEKKYPLSFLKEIPEETIKEFEEKFNVEKANIITKANALHDYCEAKGKRYKNYKSFLANALRKDFGERPPKKKKPVYEQVNGMMRIVRYE